MIPNNACLLCLTAAAGTELAEAFSGIDQRGDLLNHLVFFSLKAVYIPKDFLPHAASLRQAFAHCGIFVTAATRRCPGSVSVPMWPTILSDRLPVVALVGRYPTNKLIGHGLISDRQARRSPPFGPSECPRQDVIRYYRRFRKGSKLPTLSRCPRHITHVLLTRSPLYAILLQRIVRLACLNHAASVRSEPGSNSSIENPLTSCLPAADTADRHE